MAIPPEEDEVSGKPIESQLHEGDVGGRPAGAVPYFETREGRASFMYPERTAKVPMHDWGTGMPIPGSEIEVTLPRPPQKYEPAPTLMDLPIDEFPNWRTTNLKLHMASSPETRQKIIKDRMPGTRLVYDKYQNPMVEYKGQRYHIDRPDFLNAQDVAYGIAKSAIPLGVGLAAGAAVPAAAVGIPLAAATQMGGQSAAELANRLIAGEDVAGHWGDIILSGLVGAAPELLPVARGLQKTIAPIGKFERLPVGTRHVLATGERAGFPLPSGGEYMPIDKNPIAGLTMVAGAEPGSNLIVDRVAQRVHPDNVSARVSVDTDRILGPAPPGAETLRRNLEAERVQFGRDPMTTSLSQAGPIDIQNVINKAQSVLSQYAPGSNTHELTSSIIDNLKNFTGDAQQLQNYYRELKQNASFGPPGAPIMSKSDPRREAINNIVGSLRDELGNQVPGYNEAAKAYEGLHSQQNHFNAAKALLGSGTAADRLSGSKLTTERALEILRDAAQPGVSAELVAEADALRAGLRFEIENKIMRGTEDLSSFRKIAGSRADDPRRVILDAAFGDGAVDKMLALSERERIYRQTHNYVQDAAKRGLEIKEGRAFSGVTGKSPDTARPALSPVDLALLKLTAGQRLGHWVAGRGPIEISRGQSYLGYRPAGMKTKMSDVLSQSGAPLQETAMTMREALERDAAINRLTQMGRIPSALTKGEITGPSRREREIYYPEEQHASGGRIERASGGRTSIDHGAEADNLIALADKAKKAHNSTTEPLLDQPDEMITKALAIADKAI